MALQFTKATKEQSLLRLLIVAPSGAGKTWTSLMVGTEIAKLEGGRLAVIDSENGSASKYADKFDFDTICLPDFYVNTYVEAMNAAEEAKYPVVVIDSGSHAWESILDKRDRGFSDWKDLSPEFRRFVNRQTSIKAHLIVTMRAKTEWVIEKNDRGKDAPKKVGLGAVNRPGYEYEYDLVLYMNEAHDAQVAKTRYEIFDGKTIDRPGPKFAHDLYGAVRSGVKRMPDEKRAELNATCKTAYETLGTVAYGEAMHKLGFKKATEVVTAEDAQRVIDALTVAMKAGKEAA